MRAIPLLAGRYRIFALVRHPASGEKLRALGVLPISGDLDDRASLQRIAGIADAVLHFAPPSATHPLERGGREGVVCGIGTQHLLPPASPGELPQQLALFNTT